VEKEEAAVARQRRGKNISAATNEQATIEERLKAVFSSLYNEDQQQRLQFSNTCMSRREKEILVVDLDETRSQE
jgi:hypothetical protein